eukprot:Filipodium_phascolosomae@DN3844_c0_g1_i1.p1
MKLPLCSLITLSHVLLVSAENSAANFNLDDKNLNSIGRFLTHSLQAKIAKQKSSESGDTKESEHSHPSEKDTEEFKAGLSDENDSGDKTSDPNVTKREDIDMAAFMANQRAQKDTEYDWPTLLKHYEDSKSKQEPDTHAGNNKTDISGALAWLGKSSEALKNRIVQKMQQRRMIATLNGDEKLNGTSGTLVDDLDLVEEGKADSTDSQNQKLNKIIELLGSKLDDEKKSEEEENDDEPAPDEKEVKERDKLYKSILERMGVDAGRLKTRQLAHDGILKELSRVHDKHLRLLGDVRLSEASRKALMNDLAKEDHLHDLLLKDYADSRTKHDNLVSSLHSKGIENMKEQAPKLDEDIQKEPTKEPSQIAERASNCSQADTDAIATKVNQHIEENAGKKIDEKLEKVVQKLEKVTEDEKDLASMGGSRRDKVKR